MPSPARAPESLPAPPSAGLVPRCPNCGSAEVGAYCRDCGQKQGPLELTVREGLASFAEEFLNFDAKLLRTLGPLLFRPGLLTSEYLEGRRQRYVRPLRLFIAASVLVFFVLALLPVPKRAQAAPPPGAQGRQLGTLPQGTRLLFPGSKKELLAEVQGRWPRFARHLERFLAGGEHEVTERIQHAYVSYAPKANLLGLPLFALLLLILFGRSRRLYGDHLIFALHYHAFYFFITALNSVVVEVCALFWSWSNLLGLPAVGLVWVYLFLALRRVYGESRPRTLLKMILLLAMFAVVETILTFTILFAAVWLT